MSAGFVIGVAWIAGSVGFIFGVLYVEQSRNLDAALRHIFDTDDMRSGQ